MTWYTGDATYDTALTVAFAIVAVAAAVAPFVRTPYGRFADERFGVSLAGVYIVAVSTANLIPRAIPTHSWYRERFPDYPREQKILVPFF